MTEDEMQKLLQENLALARETRDLAAKTASYVRWVRIINIAKIVIILIPIIAAALYLPNIVEIFKAGYGGLIPTELIK